MRTIVLTGTPVEEVTIRLAGVGGTDSVTLTKDVKVTVIIVAEEK
jgi:hypothetical protein